MGLFLITIGVGLLKPSILYNLTKTFQHWLGNFIRKMILCETRDSQYFIWELMLEHLCRVLWWGMWVKKLIGIMGIKIDHYRFGLAAIGMFFAMVVFLYG
jgi:hypothetical protein